MLRSKGRVAGSCGVERFASVHVPLPSVYASSTFTIAATDPIDSASGLLRSRQPLQTENYIVHDNEESSVFFSTRYFPHFHREIDESGLNDRGWVYLSRAYAVTSNNPFL